MIKSRHNKGITLVALVITIVVLLVLAGVILNSMQESGIIGKAKTAKTETNIAAEKEQLRLAVMSAYDAKTGEVNLSTLKTNLEAKRWKLTVSGDKAICTSPKGNTFTITKTGEIAEGWVNNGDGTFTKGDTTVEIGKTTYTNAEVQEKLGATGGTYKGTWTVIGVEGDKLKLVSTKNVISSVQLGYNDLGAIEAIPLAEGEELTNTIKLERSAWSYANAVNTLNEEAKKATGIASAESITIEDIYDIIGEENVDKGSSYGTVYNYYFDTSKSKVCSKKKTGTDANGEEQWGSEFTTKYATQTFADSEGRIVTIDANNPNASIKLQYDYFDYTLTDAQKSEIGSLAIGSYWLASPCVNCKPGFARFYVRSVGSGCIRSGLVMFDFDGLTGNGYNGVRAIVSVSGL